MKSHDLLSQVVHCFSVIIAPALRLQICTRCNLIKMILDITNFSNFTCNICVEIPFKLYCPKLPIMYRTYCLPNFPMPEKYNCLTAKCLSLLCKMCETYVWSGKSNDVREDEGTGVSEPYIPRLLNLTWFKFIKIFPLFT